MIMKPLQSTSRNHVPKEVLDEKNRRKFIKIMKNRPDLWGNVNGSKKGFCTTVGSVSILNDFTAYKKSFAFCGTERKREQLTYALTQIKHLKGYYVQIKFIN
jgi:hypothetical protein